MATQRGALKRIKGFPGFVVDGFNYQSPDVRAYFLTHFHSDHTTGLHPGFRGPAPIYCSPVTASLLVEVLGVDPDLVRAVPTRTPTRVDTADGSHAIVTFLDANHCPGAVLVYMKHARTSRTALHTGDFRAAERVREDPALHDLIAADGAIGELLLDTTYCDPRWAFPTQEDVCETLGEIVREELRREPRTLFLVGSYSIGKEKAVAAVARAAGSRAEVGERRAKTLRLCGWWDDDLFVLRRERRDGGGEDEDAGGEATEIGGGGEERQRPRVRVVPMGGGSQHDAMARTLRDEIDPRTGAPRWRAVCAFRPTGWSFSRRKEANADVGRVAGAGAKTRARPLPPADDDGFVVVKLEDGSDRDRVARVKSEPRDAMMESVGRGDGDGAAALVAEAYRPWISNDGATRTYSIPYSEHSSFDELVAFVKRVRPRKVTPTVNADTPEDRDKLAKYFLPFTDLKADRARLDHYFRAPPPRSLAPSDAAPALPAPETGTELAARSEEATGAGGVDADVLAALEGVLTPAELRAQAALWAEATRPKSNSRAGDAPESSGDLGPFPLGCVALVRGGSGGFGGNGPRYAQFKDKAHVERRLRELGASCVARMSVKVTHVVVPSGGEALAEERRRHGGAGSVVVVTEGWVMRHHRAATTGAAATHPPDVISAHRVAAARERKREASEKYAAAKRRKEEKRATAAAAATAATT